MSDLNIESKPAKDASFDTIDKPSDTINSAGPTRLQQHSTDFRRKVLRDELLKMSEREENAKLTKKEARLEAERQAKEEMLKAKITKGITILPGADTSKRMVRADIKQEERLSLKSKQRELNSETRGMKADIDKKFGITDLPKGDQLVRMATEFYTHSGMPNGHLPASITQQLTTEEIADFRLVFDMFDVKSKGYITADDLKRAAAMLGLTAKKKIFKEMIESVSTDRKGRVTFINFLDLVIKVQGDGPDPLEDAKRGFSLLDKGNKGYLTISDIRTASDELEVPLSNTAIREMMMEADKTGDGVVTLSEFKQILAQTSTFSMHMGPG